MPTALITGASSGIGYDLAGIFARNRYDLVLVARNESALSRLAEQCRSQYGVKVEVLPRDLSDPAAAGQICDELNRKGINIEILVNNAGFGTHGPFAESDLAEEIRLVHVNVIALMQLTRLFLPQMIQRGSGRILNVASVAGYVPGAYMSSYYASKAFVLSHSVALARELKRTGVTVTALCPGPTRTAFQERAGMAHVKLFSRGIMDSPKVARIGYEGLMRGKTIVIPGFQNKLNAFMSRLPPKTLLARVTARLNRDR